MKELSIWNPAILGGQIAGIHHTFESEMLIPKFSMGMGVNPKANYI